MATAPSVSLAISLLRIERSNAFLGLMLQHRYSRIAMKDPYRKINGKQYSLGELISIVSSCARDSSETLAAVIDLFESGRVLLENHGRLKRVRVAA